MADQDRGFTPTFNATPQQQKEFRWYAEQIRNSIAERLTQRFTTTENNRTATPDEVVSAIRSVSVDQLTQDVERQLSTSGSSPSSSPSR
jgi:hypothetical protein